MSSPLTKEAARTHGKKNYPTDADDRAERNRQICLLVDQSPEFKAARTVALFAALPWEPDLSRLWRPKPKSFAFPKVNSTDISLTFFEIDSLRALTAGYGGILEPASGEKVEKWETADLILVPGIAFDRRGGRAGTGAGYYDRFLATNPARKWGVCFSAQLLQGTLAQEPTDVRMDAIVTEKGIVRVHA